MAEVTTGTLYIVATPIGNMKDITLRALEILKSVDLIACEDTRVTGKLCARYDIDTRRTAIHHHSADSKLAEIVRTLVAGKNIAYVSDAGTPGVSDPGNQLVALAREENIRVEPIPGASAVATVISVAGIDMQQFTFMAYPPHKKGRKTFFEKVVASEIPVVYYDSVHRVIKNLQMLSEMKSDANIILGRELTKMHEEVVRGTAQEVIAYFEEDPGKVKGEFVVITY